VQRVAAAWPERLRRAVTIAVPPPAVIAPMLTDPAQLQRFFYIWMFQLDGLPEAVLGADRALIDHLWATWSPGLTMPEDLRTLVHQTYGDPRFIRSSLRIYRANFDTALEDPALAGLASRTEAPASTPLLLLAGADDGCIGSDMFADAGRGLAPGSRTEILPGVGHFLHLETPETVAGLALDWFEQR
jgi:pimeloyl-ACP methyl ester carboxylesterase